MEVRLREKIAIQAGISGSALGILAGLIELTIGTQIRPWIGNKESPAILGVVTFLLSVMAFAAVIAARKRETQTNDWKLAIFLGVLLPASICFTTVGRLWYLPGTLLLASAVLFAFEFWLKPQSTVQSRPSDGAWRLMAGIGSLVILLSIGLAFWNSSFGLFQVEVPVRADRLRLEVLPIDFVRRTAFTNGARLVEDLESSQVRSIYLGLILGAALAFNASLVSSRLYIGIGGGVVLLGLLLSLVWLPVILSQAQYTSAYPNLLKSLGWGWYLSAAGLVMILGGAFWKHVK
jgi:hypothetical protein